MFSKEPFLITMANLSAIFECLVVCDRASLDNPKNPQFYRFTRSVSDKLTNAFGKRFLKSVDP